MSNECSKDKNSRRSDKNWKRVFKGCSSLTSVVLPKVMKSIGYGAFSHTNISSITIPEGVTTIGNRCFYECSSLKNIELPTTLISISDNAFSTHSTFNIETKIVKMKVNSRI